MSKYNPISEERKRERKQAIIKEIKNLIFPVVVLGLVFLAFLFIKNYQEIEPEEEIIPVQAYAGDAKEYVMENDAVKFVMDPITTNFDVTVKSSGKVWHSCAVGGENDAIAVTEEKNKLMSPLVLTYSNEAGLEVTYDAYSYSALNGIYNIEQGDDYIRVDYSLGKVAKEFVIPPVITEERYKLFTGNMTNSELANIEAFYKKYDIKKLKKKDNKEELLASYPILADTVIYVLNTEKMKDVTKATLQKAFENAGYTYEDYLEDKELDLSESSDDTPVFDISVIYRLEGDDLTVEVPFDSIISKTEFPIYNISILPYFGAGGKEDNGFLFVPEGGGSVIDFNNGKTAQSVYVSNVYGWNMAIARDALVHSTLANMNLYGISDSKDSFICIIEEGAPYAAIRADIGGRFSTYNFVNALYTIKEREKYNLGSNSNQDVYVYQTNLPDESIKTRYSFVDSGSYVDMAKDYRDYLLDTYPNYFDKNDDSEAPLVLEVVGAVDKVKQIVGVPVSRPLALTTYEEAANLITDVKESGVNNLSIKYTGWCNGGVKQKFLKKIKRIWALGSNKDIQNLSDTAKANDVDLYLDGITSYEFNSNIFNGFFSFRDAAKFLAKERAELYIYSDVTYAAREGLAGYYLLRGDTILDMCHNLVSKCQKLGTGVSFHDIGEDLSSDFNKRHITTREEARVKQQSMLQETKDSGTKIMVNSGNAYSVPYADVITNMDLKGSEYTILDRTVPFYQIALHGYVDYTSFPINTNGNETEEILHCAEYGAGMNFSIMTESAFTLQKTLYTEYYASDYAVYKNRMLSIYNRYNEQLGHTFNQEIVNHTYVAENVSLTEYEDGTKVYVNYNFVDKVCDGQTIAAREYLVVR